ncbi:hypothetical protein CEXT_138471 [Caerostris extrusa]|uniref:Uncharacterized protein n=1 Tax=Caerostris extrusa TaxID=172846 RepID=A0AAV4VPH9_CAEEX|nr:hypothetical protein CEXT_138471 [Caerostris extrusa]
MYYILSFADYLEHGLVAKLSAENLWDEVGIFENWNTANDYEEIIYDSRHHCRDNSQIRVLRSRDHCAVFFGTNDTTSLQSNCYFATPNPHAPHLPPVPFIVRVQQPIPRLPI